MENGNLELILNLKIIQDLSLSPDEYIYLYCISKGQIDLAYDICNIELFELRKLQRLEYLDILNEKRTVAYGNGLIEVSEPEVQITAKGLQLFQSSEIQSTNEWEVFKELYPKKSGQRALRTDQEHCKKKFAKLVQAGEYEKIIKGLKNEIRARQISTIKREFFQEWQLMRTYLNQRTWEQYQDDNTSTGLSSVKTERI